MKLSVILTHADIVAAVRGLLELRMPQLAVRGVEFSAETQPQFDQNGHRSGQDQTIVTATVEAETKETPSTNTSNRDLQE